MRWTATDGNEHLEMDRAMEVAASHVQDMLAKYSDDPRTEYLVSPHLVISITYVLTLSFLALMNDPTATPDTNRATADHIRNAMIEAARAARSSREEEEEE